MISPSAMVRIATPGHPNGLSVSSRNSATRRARRAQSGRRKGKLARKIQRQPNPVPMMPPEARPRPSRPRGYAGNSKARARSPNLGKRGRDRGEAPSHEEGPPRHPVPRGRQEDRAVPSEAAGEGRYEEVSLADEEHAAARPKAVAMAPATSSVAVNARLEHR